MRKSLLQIIYLQVCNDSVVPVEKTGAGAGDSDLDVSSPTGRYRTWSPMHKLWIYAATPSYVHLMVLLISCPGKTMTEVTGKEQSFNYVVVK